MPVPVEWSAEGTRLSLHLSGMSDDSNVRQSLAPAFDAAEHEESNNNASSESSEGLTKILNDRPHVDPFEFVQETPPEEMEKRESDLPFHGMTFYVEVLHEGGKVNGSDAFASMINRMGGSINLRLSKKVNLIVFGQGRQSTLDKAKQLDITVVNVFWVEKCRKEKRKVDYDDFAVTKNEACIPSPDLVFNTKAARLPPIDKPKPFYLSAATLERRRVKRENMMMRQFLREREAQSSADSSATSSQASPGVSFQPLGETPEADDLFAQERRERLQKLCDELSQYTDSDEELEDLVRTPLSERIKRNYISENRPVPECLEQFSQESQRAEAAEKEKQQEAEATEPRQSRSVGGGDGSDSSISLGPINVVLRKTNSDIPTKSVAVNTSDGLMTQTEKIVKDVEKEMAENDGEPKRLRRLSRARGVKLGSESPRDDGEGEETQEPQPRKRDNSYVKMMKMINEVERANDAEAERKRLEDLVLTPRRSSRNRKRKSDEAVVKTEPKAEISVKKQRSVTKKPHNLIVHTTSEALNELQLGAPTSEEFDSSAKRRKRRVKRRKPLRDLVMTSMNVRDRETAFAVMRKLGKYRNETTVGPDTTHVVCGDASRRTLSILQAVARGIWLVSHEWIFRSLEAGAWLPEAEFELAVRYPTCKTRRIEKVRGTPGRPLEGIGPIHVTQDAQPTPADLYSLIEIMGGKISPSTKRASLVIGRPDFCNSPLVIQSGVKVVSEQWLLDSVERGSAQPFGKYLQTGTPASALKTPKMELPSRRRSVRISNSEKNRC